MEEKLDFSKCGNEWCKLGNHCMGKSQQEADISKLVKSFDKSDLYVLVYYANKVFNLGCLIGTELVKNAKEAVKKMS